MRLIRNPKELMDRISDQQDSPLSGVTKEVMSANISDKLVVKMEVRYSTNDYSFTSEQLSNIFLNQLLATCERYRIIKEDE